MPSFFNLKPDSKPGKHPESPSVKHNDLVLIVLVLPQCNSGSPDSERRRSANSRIASGRLSQCKVLLLVVLLRYYGCSIAADSTVNGMLPVP